MVKYMKGLEESSTTDDRKGGIDLGSSLQQCKGREGCGEDVAAQICAKSPSQVIRMLIVPNPCNIITYTLLYVPRTFVFHVTTTPMTIPS